MRIEDWLATIPFMPPSDLDPFALAARKYKDFPGDPERVYRALCYALSERIAQVDWEAFTGDDWRILPPMAEAEGVAPLMYVALRAMCDVRSAESEVRGAKCEVPEGVLAQLEASYYRTAAHNALLLRELERILEAFEQAGIEVVLLKGAALAQTVYPDPALRPMSDIDLLVRPEDARRAQSALESLEYHPTAPEIFAGFHRQFGSHVHLTQASLSDAYVELHWGLFSGPWDRREPSLAWFWERSKPLDARHTPGARIMGAEAALLYLSAHLTLKHGGHWERMVWRYDLYLLLQANNRGLGWESILKQATAFGWEKSLAAAMRDVCQTFPLRLPKEVDVQLKALERRKTTPLRQSTTAPDLHTLNTWNFLRYLNWPARLRLAVGLLFPSPAYMHWHYQPQPAWAWPFYYPYRWMILLRDNWRAFHGQRKRV